MAEAEKVIIIGFMFGPTGGYVEVQKGHINTKVAILPDEEITEETLPRIIARGLRIGEKDRAKAEVVRKLMYVPIELPPDEGGPSGLVGPETAHRPA